MPYLVKIRRMVEVEAAIAVDTSDKDEAEEAALYAARGKGDVSWYHVHDHEINVRTVEFIG